MHQCELADPVRLYFDVFVLQQSIYLFTEAEEIIELSYKLI